MVLEQVYTFSTLYAVLAMMPKDEIAVRCKDKSMNQYWVQHCIGFWEIAIATTFQVTYRAKHMHEDFMRSCKKKDMHYLAQTKMFLCDTILTTSVVGLIYSIHVDHLLWSGVYPTVHIATVLDTFNLMAAHCTRDFSLSSKDTFDLWQSLCAHVACIEILRLEGKHRDLDHTLMEELKRVLGIDKWLAEQANALQHEQLVALYNRISASKDLE
jgi:hypothetical protein